MALANYTDLQASVAAFLHRSDLTGIIPDLITLAEIRINGDLDARLQDVSTTISTVAGTQTVASPSDLINIRSLVLQNNQNVVLVYQSPDQFNIDHPYSTSTGVPTKYTVIGSSIYLAPIPDNVYTIQAIYKGRVPSLSSNGTTWLMTNYPHVYLYATLCEAAPYLKDDARVALWENKYKESIGTVNQQDWYSGSTMRVMAK